MSDQFNDLAGAAGPSDSIVPLPPEPRELQPVRFENDFKDFRPVSEDIETVPKVLPALASAESPPSPTGLEDVSSDDLENPVTPTVTKVTNPVPKSGSQISSKVI